MAKNDKEVKEKKQKNSYFKDMKAELKKVVWPTPKELVNSTVAVIVFVLILAVIVFILDFCFDNLNKYGITRLQESVKSSFQTTDDSAQESENQESENNESSENLTEDSNVVVNESEENQAEGSEENKNETSNENEEQTNNIENNTTESNE